MERISLLPPEIKKARQEKESRQKVQLLILLFLVLLVLVNAYYLTNYLLVRETYKSLQLERETVDREAAKLEEYAILHREISASEQLIAKAMGTVPQWSAFFRHISQVMPVTAWFSDLTAIYSDQEKTLTIRGWSYDHGSLADLLERLETMEQLDQVQCRVSTETDYQGQDAIQFEIDAILLSSPGSSAEEEGGSD